MNLKAAYDAMREDPDRMAREMNDLLYGDGLDIKKALADEAVKCVTGERRAAYGKPEQNFGRIAALWSAYMESLPHAEDCAARDFAFRPVDVAHMMVLMKIARLCETPEHRDSYLDMVGYVLCGAEIALGAQPRPIDKVLPGVAALQETPQQVADRAIEDNPAWDQLREYRRVMAADRAPKNYQGFDDNLPWGRMMQPAETPQQKADAALQTYQDEREPAWKQAEVGDKVQIRTERGTRVHEVVAVYDGAPTFLRVQISDELGFRWVRNEDVLCVVRECRAA